VLVVLLAAACAVGGLQVVHTHRSRALDDEQQARYGAALAAAVAEASAYVNVRHDRAAADLARIASGATGDLKKRYTEDAVRFARLLRRSRTVTSGEVLWAGVVQVDARGATVLVATTGTRADRRTDGKPVSRDLRLQLTLVPVDGRWLASDIGLVD
jgi:Mce-associated membrane protein